METAYTLESSDVSQVPGLLHFLSSLLLFLSLPPCLPPTTMLDFLPPQEPPGENMTGDMQPTPPPSLLDPLTCWGCSDGRRPESIPTEEALATETLATSLGLWGTWEAVGWEQAALSAARKPAHALLGRFLAVAQCQCGLLTLAVQFHTSYGSWVWRQRQKTLTAKEKKKKKGSLEL